MPDLSPRIYCIDSSSLMNLEGRMPPDIVPGLWDDLGDLAGAGRLKSHREVFEEIQRGSGPLVDWSRKHREIFLEHTAEQATFVKQIVNQFPNLSGASKVSPYEADAWLIALSLCNGNRWIVVNDENPRPERGKIPAACHAFQVPSLKSFEFLREQGWRYVRTPGG